MEEGHRGDNKSPCFLDLEILLERSISLIFLSPQHHLPEFSLLAFYPMHPYLPTMAIGKPRGNKRPYDGSYSVTATMLVFIFVCVFGVWMLTSTSLVSPQKKSRIRKETYSSLGSTFESVHHKANLPRKIPIPTATVFNDNPGDLPSDAIKSNDDLKGHEREITNNVATVNYSEVGKKEAGQQMTSLTAGVTENQHGLQENTQTSKQNAMPQKRHTEKIITAKKDKETGRDQEKGENDHRESNREKIKDKQTYTNEGKKKLNLKNNMADEEKKTRMKRQQEEEKTKRGETGDDHVQYNEDTQNESHLIATETNFRAEHQEAQEVSKQKMKQARIRTTPINGTTSQEHTKLHETISSEVLNDSKNAWLTQARQSANQVGRKRADNDVHTFGYEWKLCNVSAGTDYVPCLDNEKAIINLHGRNHFEHRERHCPEESPTCLVPLPKGYKTSIPWPQSRDKIWFHNVPHKSLAEVKGHQNWVKTTGEFHTFPGGGTQFVHGALHYINFLQQIVSEIAWGKHTRVILDVGCGVASFGGYLFDKNVLTMSFAPKDEHEAQIQFALERGIPAISAVMGTKRLPFPSNVFDLVHCARCRVPWHKEGGKLLLELNRVLRPGGYFVWSATPVYQKREEDVQIWKDMSALTLAMCWELVTIKKDKMNAIGVAVYQKPDSNECYDERIKQEPPMCKKHDVPDAAWYIPLQACLHKVPTMETERGSQWPEEWPARVQTPPYWLNDTLLGIYGKPTPNDFKTDYKYWKQVVSKTYMSGLEINWSNVRNVMDMRAVYGGFAAALTDLNLWVLNVVNIDSPDTLPIIYERGLFGIYHDWCESFSTYPRTYDLLHADHLFSKLKKRCKITLVIVEVDRIMRPGGKLIIRDESNMIAEIENLLKSLHWEVHLTFKNQEQILSAQKSTWRPKIYASSS